jgi:hypothetical protein
MACGYVVARNGLERQDDNDNNDNCNKPRAEIYWCLRNGLVPRQCRRWRSELLVAELCVV